MINSLATLRPAWLALAIAVSAFPARAQKDQDKVSLREGATEVGKVLEESFAGVTLQPEKGAKKTIPWEQVQNVEYFDAPEAMGSGLATLGAGNLEAALAHFQTVLDAEQDGEMRPVVVQQALFYAAFIQQRLGAANDAIQRYQTLIETFPTGRYVGLAAENLVTLKLAAGDGPGAAQVVDTVTAGAKDLAGFAPQAQLLQAWLLESQGKIAEARNAYTAVESSTGAAKGFVQEAKLGKGRTLLRDGKRTEAEPIFRALVAESSSSRVQSGAWNALGEISAEEGKAARDYDRIYEALYAYLRTVVQYKPLLGESTREYERALAGAAQCFQYLSELEQNPDKKKNQRERSRNMLEQLRQEYPNSAFIKKT